MKALLKNNRISPKKANLIADLVRGKNVKEALDILKFTPKRPAITLAKVILSAAGNAEKNFGQDKDKLFIKNILVSGGQTYKRFRPVSRGRAHPILKRTCHITVQVESK